MATQWLPPTNKVLTRTFNVLFVLTWMVMLVLSEPLKTTTAPLGILSLEFAFDLTRAHEVIQSWSQPQLLLAAFSCGFDYVFMLCYSTFFAFAVFSCARVSSGLLRDVGIVLAYGQWVAGVADALENAGMLTVIFDTLPQWQAKFIYCAALAAFVKFGLILLGIVFIAVVKVKAMLFGPTERARRPRPGREHSD
eukprot:TRINITY_DN11667_c0_g1_i1.p1 TRINITY_DN11667_c0_g1~~TRINITY_DN11667_c0_g1_i1.p1  ORF type:complete len:194 (+),score=44.43 TRINITY_DN11667_c0_g1_i1:35-616(+)